MSSEYDNGVPASNDTTGADPISTNQINTDPINTDTNETDTNETDTDAVKRAGIGDLGDVAHPFDQTNGIVDGLDGNANDAETYNERNEDDSFVAGAPGVGGVAGAGVVGTDRDDVERDE